MSLFHFLFTKTDCRYSLRRLLFNIWCRQFYVQYFNHFHTVSTISSLNFSGIIQKNFILCFLLLVGFNPIEVIYNISLCSEYYRTHLVLCLLPLAFPNAMQADMIGAQALLGESRVGSNWSNCNKQTRLEHAHKMLVYLSGIGRGVTGGGLLLPRDAACPPELLQLFCVFLRYIFLLWFQSWHCWK